MTFINPARQNQLSEETFWTILRFVGLLLQWKQTAHSRILLLETHSCVIHLISEKNWRFEEGQPIVDTVAVDRRPLHVTTKKAMIFQTKRPLIANIFNDRYALVFDITSKQSSIEEIKNPCLVGEPLGPSFPFRNMLLSSLIFANDYPRLQLRSEALSERRSKLHKAIPQQKVNRIRVSSIGSFVFPFQVVLHFLSMRLLTLKDR